MFFKRPIFVSLSPNIEKDDFWLALKLIFSVLSKPALAGQHWKWKNGPAVNLLEKSFAQYLNSSPANNSSSWQAFAFNSGRAGFLAILNALGLEKGDEVLLQAFTCNAAVNPIIWSGLKPVYVDIEKETLNLDPKDLERKIGPKSRAVLVQHTFGLPAKMNKILAICNEHNLILIEDCAHSLGAVYQGKKIGTFGRAVFFSLGRDKIISSVCGGIAVVPDPVLAEKIKIFQEQCPIPSHRWILQQLLHPVLTKALIMPLYGFWGIGKYVLIGLQKIKIISKAVLKEEKQGQKPKNLVAKMPNALAILALNQLEKLDRFNQHRRKIAEIYDKDLSCAQSGDRIGRIFMKYPVLLPGGDTDKVLKKFRGRKIFLDDGWRKAAIVPPDTNQEKMLYQKNSCSVSQEVADSIVNLPTHINISPEIAERIIKIFKEIRF